MDRAKVLDRNIHCPVRARGWSTSNRVAYPLQFIAEARTRAHPFIIVCPRRRDLILEGLHLHGARLLRTLIHPACRLFLAKSSGRLTDAAHAPLDGIGYELVALEAGQVLLGKLRNVPGYPIDVVDNVLQRQPLTLRKQ
jgi:hypothetical protein